ncbi:MAG: pyridoxal phosphate-dependent aminotransferase [Clostridiales bacterium]|nr:pyridoxal phosphate-dependent aminotransferase [Clostridiales bacterium]
MVYTKDYFDEYLERRGTGSNKWDGCNQKFGVDASVEMIPMWIADMDFRSPVEVIDAIKKKAAAEAYGYSKPDSFYQAVIGWVKRRYHWDVKKEWIIFTPGVIPGFHIAIQNFTKEGDGIIVQPPVYYPFMDGVRDNKRTLVFNPLIEENGRWLMDYEDLEAKVKDPRNKMLILSNPHNPVGRSWTADELERLGTLCLENDVLLISDEIHADLMMGGHEHHAVCAVSDKLKQCTITQYASSKTFNLAGLQTSVAIIPNDEKREVFLKGVNANRIFNMNWFGAAALETAYNQCEGYVEALCSYVDANMNYMKDFLEKRLPALRMEKSEATYMVWVDFRGTGMTTEEIEHFIAHKAHIGVDMGSWFGPGGEGYLRFNLACPRSILEKALIQLEKTFE